ncbi:hypothetical protein ACIRF8_24130 [Streptomyces sp. NPDC102406]|uniref:hypothetical protein n=1 Tax=Streptomyces sp. NPDC102406 TaxID=3366171 RepID=UPI00381CAE82
MRSSRLRLPAAGIAVALAAAGAVITTAPTAAAATSWKCAYYMPLAVPAGSHVGFGCKPPTGDGKAPHTIEPAPDYFLRCTSYEEAGLGANTIQFNGCVRVRA